MEDILSDIWFIRVCRTTDWGSNDNRRQAVNYPARKKTWPLHKLAARGIGTPQKFFDLLHNTISDFFCIKPKPKEVNLGY